MTQDRSTSNKAMPAKGPGQALVRVSVIVVLAAGVGGFFLRALAERVFGVEELVPLPAIHLRPDILFFVGPVPVSSTLLSAWLVTLALIGVFRLAMGTELPPLGQLRRAVELLLEFLYGIFKWVVGETQSPWTFSFIATIFLYVIANAWVTLLPVYGPLQFRLSDGSGAVVPLLRGAGTDINMPLALALVAGVYVELHGLRSRGTANVWEYFPFRPFLQGRVLTGLYEMYLAALHGLTHLVRLFSFTLHLFGTLTAGELLPLVICSFPH